MLLSLFRFFLTLGFISFGGGYPMMSFILSKGQEAVGLTAQEFADMTALELLASGPISINAATYIGYLKADFIGAVVATLGVCLPSFLLTTVLYAFLRQFRDNRYVAQFIETLKIACGGVLLSTGLTLSQSILFSKADAQAALAPQAQPVAWPGVLIVLLSMAALMKYRINPILVLAGAAVAGILML